MLRWTPNKGVINQRTGKLDKLSQNAQAQTGYPRVQCKYALHKKGLQSPNPGASWVAFIREQQDKQNSPKDKEHFQTTLQETRQQA